MLSLLLIAALSFHTEHLAVDGVVEEALAADLDGDGKPDLLVAAVSQRKGEMRRSFSVFWNDDGKFSNADKLTVVAPHELGAFDVGDAGQGTEIFSLAHDGVSALSLRGRKEAEWRHIINQPTLFLRAPAKQLDRWHLVQNFGGQNLTGPRLVVPSTSTMTIYAKAEKPDAFTRRGVVALDLEASFQNEARERYPKQSTQLASVLDLHIPAVYVADMNGDGRLDLAIVQGERLTAFAQTANGDIAPTPLCEHRFSVHGPDQDARVNLMLADVDGDGRADVVATKEMSAGILSATTTVFLFRAGADGYSSTPDQVIESDGASLGAVQITDLNGDGHPDLLLPAVRIGILAIMRMLTTKQIKVDFSLYPFTGAHFADHPTATRSLSFGLDLGHNTQTQLVDMYGDYDGDGRVDLAFGSEANEVSFLRGGDGGKIFANEAVAKVAVPAKGHARPLDLQHNGKSSLLIFYPGDREKKSDVVLLQPD